MVVNRLLIFFCFLTAVKLVKEIYSWVFFISIYTLITRSFSGNAKDASIALSNRFPIITHKSNSDVFNLIGICQKALKKNGYYNEASELFSRVTNSHSYDEALQIMCEYVNHVSELDENFSDYDDFYCSNIGI